MLKRDIVKRALKGDKFKDLNIIDAHCHLNSIYEYYNPKAGIVEMLKEADGMGVGKICIAPIEGISFDPNIGNMHMLEAISKYPERVYGYIVINPNFPELIDDLVKTCRINDNVLGIKLHPWIHRYDVFGENYIKAFDRLDEIGGIILSHAWQTTSTCSVEACEEVIRAYPGIPFIIGHSAGTAEGIRKAIKTVNRYENAYMDTCGTFLSNIRIEEMVSHTASGKILYSSDYPYHDLRVELSNILFADMDDDTKIDILGENFRNLLKKYLKQNKNLGFQF